MIRPSLAGFEVTGDIVGFGRAMNIRYRNTFRDVMAFCFYHYPRSPLVIASYGLGFAVLSLVVFQGLPKNVSVAARVMALIIGESIVFVFFAVVFGFSVVLGMVSRKNKTLLTERNMTFDDHGFTFETQYSRSEMK